MSDATAVLYSTVLHIVFFQVCLYLKLLLDIYWGWTSQYYVFCLCVEFINLCPDRMLHFVPGFYKVLL